MSEQPEYIIPVAMHRWLEDGEGWAYHPKLEAKAEQACLHNEVVKQQLDERKAILLSGRYADNAGPPGSFDGERTDRDGFLLGIQEEDKQCPDPKAVDDGRFPTKLWVAFLPAEPKPEYRAKILNRLRSLDSKRFDADPGLYLSLDGNMLQPKNNLPANNTPTSSKKGRFFMTGTMLLIGILIGCGLTFEIQIPWFKAGAKTHDVNRAVEIIERTDGKPVAKMGQNSETITLNDFFKRYSQDQYWSGKEIPGKHPDVELFKKLPKKPLCEKRPAESYSKSELLDGLRQLMKVLYPEGDPIIADIDSDNDDGRLTETIENLAWLDIFHAKQELYDYPPDSEPVFPWDQAPPEELKNFTVFLRERLEKRKKGDAPRVADVMLENLQRWGVKGLSEEDTKLRPEVVVRCFVGFLTLPEETNIEEASPQVRFLDNFARGPIPEELLQTALPDEKVLKVILEKHFGVEQRSRIEQTVDEIVAKFVFDEAKLKTPLREERESKLKSSPATMRIISDVRKANLDMELRITKKERNDLPDGIEEIIVKKGEEPKFTFNVPDIPDKSSIEAINRFVERFKTQEK